MILVVDNYDSFTYNLVHYLAELGAETHVIRNDDLTAAEALALRPEALLLSPGPCTPNEAGICLDLIRNAPEDLPILGVCLGHQAIGQAFGGNVIRAKALMHGKTSPIHHEGESLFRSLPSPFTATRYHSLAVRRETLPNTLKVTAWTADDEIMGLMHHARPIHGVQFHPESIATEHGHAMLANFLDLAGVRRLTAA
ncbi:MAG: anthranilate synthase component II [Brevundimonas sp.]|jgi:anthranilate synthase component 2|uniref:anthranilate synthase component II n=1 Tax=Brevundimonas sp. TaxID=1871086 RepID=UPI0022BE5243|nr:aminodeoxychorismate/anthranilate synthase component II [Brevundimonas sp.]MCZ8087158.1 aminodeoxychorismate/anthranilate synthase component II [Brevundimonas sp.]MCZ8193066.1 aminodeoxychorismate/anthranilate synthase component II [Brevundimonas sp.]